MWDCLRHPKPSSRHVLNVLMGCCCRSWFPLPCFANISLRKAEAVKHLYQVSDEISYQPCTPRSLFVNVVIMSFSTSILTPTSCTSGACFKLWHPLTSYDCDLPSTRTLTWQHHRPMIALFLDTFWPCVSCVSHLWCLPQKRLNLCILCWRTLFFHRLSNFQPLCNLFPQLLSYAFKPDQPGEAWCVGVLPPFGESPSLRSSNDLTFWSKSSLGRRDNDLVANKNWWRMDFVTFQQYGTIPQSEIHFDVEARGHSYL